MALRYEVASLDGIPDNLRSLYVPKDGKFVLDVEGVVSSTSLAEANGRLVEFRDNNVKILKALGADSVDSALQRATLFSGIDPAKLERLKAIDPDKYAALEAKFAKLKEKGVDNPDDLDGRVQSLLEKALGPVTQKLEAAEKARAEAQSRADKATLREVIGGRFQKAGGRVDALDFIMAQAEQDFHVVDGVVKARDGRFSPERPSQALTEDDFVASTAKKYAFAFEPSKGGGTPPNGNGNGAGAPRPGVRQLKDPTPQELGELKFESGKGLVDRSGQPVEIVQ